MQNYKKVIIICVILSVLIISLYIYFFFIPKKAKDQESTKPPFVKETLPDKSQHSVKLKKEEPEIPELDIQLKNSDEVVRKYLKKCSSHPKFLKWLKKEELVRTFVAVIDNISRGESPAPLLESLRLREKFKSIQNHNSFKIDTSGYTRYTPFIEVLISLKSDVLSSLYSQLKPLIDQAYKELGYPEEDFENTLIQAVNVILKTPVVEGDIHLEKKIIAYAFEDINLEHLQPAQKHLIRMGPEHTRRIHFKLRKIAKALKIPPEKLVHSSLYKRE